MYRSLIPVFFFIILAPWPKLFNEICTVIASDLFS